MDLGEGFQDSQVTRDLGLSAAAGAVVRNGTAAETVVEALTRLNRVNENWYFLCVSESYVDTADISAMADWAAANDKMLIIDTHQASARDPAAAVAAGIALALSEAGSENVAAVYSGHSDYKAVSLAARFSSVNFGGRDTLINGKFRTLPSVTPDDSLTEAEENVLKERRINFYKTLGNEPVVQDGQTFGGWIDVQFWLDWFTDKVRRDVYDLLRSTARVPQTTGRRRRAQGRRRERLHPGRAQRGHRPGHADGDAGLVRPAGHRRRGLRRLADLRLPGPHRIAGRADAGGPRGAQGASGERLAQGVGRHQPC